MSAQPNRNSRRRVLLGVALAVTMVCAVLVAVALHAHLFAAPPGVFVASSVSPDHRWEARKSAIWPPAGGSFTWRIEVRSLEGPHSSWRTVYLGPAGESPTHGAPAWSNATTIIAAGRSMDVRGGGYLTGWMTVGEAVVAWLLTLGAGLLVLVAGVVVTWLMRRLAGRGGGDPTSASSRPASKLA
jgi:drug/metabolite transporter superfamily protein YnfA